ncbi:hypothetical protein [Pyrococcus kukulkanii]|uniref:hypothetical protein n=1 Tax=Pyrococcus kukulkanii TaxID=1609559 RepID=UPI0035649A69
MIKRGHHTQYNRPMNFLTRRSLLLKFIPTRYFGGPAGLRTPDLPLISRSWRKLSPLFAERSWDLSEQQIWASRITQLANTYHTEYCRWLKARVVEKVFRQYCSIVGKIAGGWNIFKARSKNEVRGVRSFLNFLVEQGILDETTANDIKKRIKFKENEHVDTTVFTVQEVIELLSRTQTSDPRLHYLIRLGLESGLRRSELVLAVQKLRSEGFQSEGKVAWVSLNKNTKTKRAFVCFLSIEVAKYFANRKVKVSLDILNNYSKRENIK